MKVNPKKFLAEMEFYKIDPLTNCVPKVPTKQYTRKPDDALMAKIWDHITYIGYMALHSHIGIFGGKFF
jgi:hypothetical protein